MNRVAQYIAARLQTHVDNRRHGEGRVGYCWKRVFVRADREAVPYTRKVEVLIHTRLQPVIGSVKKGNRLNGFQILACCSSPG